MRGNLKTCNYPWIKGICMYCKIVNLLHIWPNKIFSTPYLLGQQKPCHPMFEGIEVFIASYATCIFLKTETIVQKAHANFCELTEKNTKYCLNRFKFLVNLINKQFNGMSLSIDTKSCSQLQMLRKSLFLWITPASQPNYDTVPFIVLIPHIQERQENSFMASYRTNYSELPMNQCFPSKVSSCQVFRVIK